MTIIKSNANKKITKIICKEVIFTSSMFSQLDTLSLEQPAFVIIIQKAIKMKGIAIKQTSVRKIDWFRKFHF